MSRAAGLRATVALGAALPAALLAALLAALPGGPARAQGGEAATIAELRRQLDAMQRRLEQRERRQSAPAEPRHAARRAAPAATAAAAAAAPDVVAAQAAARDARAAAERAEAAARGIAPAALALQRDVPGLAPADPEGREFGTEEALRSDLPGIALRVPGTDTSVRLTGFAKLTAWTDASSRNRTDAPAPSLLPLRGSPGDREGGDFGMTARFSRFGVDSRMLTARGTLETRIEGDFGGGAATFSNAVFRLRQPWA